MQIPYGTVVINAAGRGSRLGQALNKSLLVLEGSTILERQLRSIPLEARIIIGIGYQAERVAEEAIRVRSDITFAYNPDFERTGTARTLALSAGAASGRIVSIDGDLLVDSTDMNFFLQAQENLLGITTPTGREPVYCLCSASADAIVVRGFTRAHSGGVVEWSGLANLDAADLASLPNEGHVYEMLPPLLPIKAMQINCAEIDFPEDIDLAIEWLHKLKGPSS